LLASPQVRVIAINTDPNNTLAIRLMKFAMSMSSNFTILVKLPH
jgi:hypothetical protein